MKKTKTKSWGFDVRNIDHSIRPQDDFYNYANGGWIRRNKIPPAESRWGSFNILRYETEKQLYKIVTHLIHAKNVRRQGPERLVRDFYLSAIDMKIRNNLGIKPLIPWRVRLQYVSSLQELVDFVSQLHPFGISTLWSVGLDQDAKNSDRYLLQLWQGGLSLPDREYYLSNSSEHVRVREAYTKHIQKLLALSGFSSVEISYAQKVILDIETKLAKASMSKEDSRDSEKTYHKFPVTQFAKIVKQVNWKRYFISLGAHHLKEVNVGQPEFFTAIGRLLVSLPLDQWKIYVEWHLINETASLLSEPFIRENFSFYGTVLTGVKKMRPLWRRALSAVTANLGEALGKLYVESYFPAQSKKIMDILVSDLFEVYAERIKSLKWMSSKTKRKAIIKLQTMKRKIGYPDRFEQYHKLVVVKDDFFGNILHASEFEHRKEMRKLSRPVDRKEWFMTPQTVNAYCHFNLNEIVFPAAFLQFPFFDMHADDAVNYGAIGSVIGHEMTHGFDDQGSKFDSKGNLKTWWTPGDRRRFTTKANVLVSQFNDYTVVGGVSVNGQLTLGENIADLGGLAIAYEAYQKRLEKTERASINGFTPEERFFLGFAQAEQEINRDEFIKMRVLTDPHAPSPNRINGPLSNFRPFYKAFSVVKGDRLYRNANKRVEIW